MSTNLATFVIGLNYGDEGKGSVVDWLCRTTKVDLVVRYNGGPQAGHNVVSPDGKRHCFHTFGSGTLAGVKTLLAEPFVFDPFLFVKEANELTDLGVPDIYSMIAIDYRCKIIDPFSMAVNRSQMILSNSHNSCGIGFGKTVELGSKAITAAQFLSNPFGHCNRSLSKIVDYYKDTFIDSLTEDQIILLKNDPSSFFWVFENPAAIISSHIANTREILTRIRFFDSFHAKELQKENLHIVFEGAQGLALDQTYSDPNFGTYSDITPKTVIQSLKNNKLLEFLFEDLEIKVIGVTRSYTTRHGDGPLKGEIDFEKGNYSLGDYKEQDNPTNPYQGHFRYTPINNACLLTSAKILENIGYPLSGIFINHCDSPLCYFTKNTPNKISQFPVLFDNNIFFTPDNYIFSSHTERESHDEQAICHVNFYSYLRREKHIIKDLITNYTFSQIPVVGIGMGPTAEDKYLVDENFFKKSKEVV